MSDLPELVPATAAAGGDTSSITADEAGLRRRGRTEKREDDAAGDTAGGAPEASLEAMEAEMAKREKKERKQRVRRPRERSKAPSEASDSESEPLDRAKLSPIANRLLEELEADEAAAPSGPARFCRSIVLPIIITLFAFAIISVFKPSYEDWRRVAGAAMMTDEEQIKLQQEAGILPKPAAPAASRAGEAAIKPLRLPQRKGNQPMVIDSKGLTQSQVTDLAPTNLIRGLLKRIQTELPGVLVSFSGVQETGGNLEQGALVLAAGETKGGDERFIVGSEFAHFHLSADNSLHVMLPPSTRSHVIETGWAISGHIPANAEHNIPGVEKPGMVFVFGPRSEKEAEFVWEIVFRSWGWATGRFEG